MQDDTQSLIVELQRLMQIHGNPKLYVIDPMSGAYVPVQVQTPITMDEGKPRVSFLLAPASVSVEV